MGWCSGTEVFDKICETALFGDFLPFDKQVHLLIAMISAFEDRDWDCQDDSGYRDHPAFKAAMRQVHPDWDWLFDDESSDADEVNQG